MSERTEKKRPLLMPPYWGRPPRQWPAPSGPFNKQQKQFRLVLRAFMLAKILAAATMAFLIIWMI